MKFMRNKKLTSLVVLFHEWKVKFIIVFSMACYSVLIILLLTVDPPSVDFGQCDYTNEWMAPYLFLIFLSASLVWYMFLSNFLIFHQRGLTYPDFNSMFLGLFLMTVSGSCMFIFYILRTHFSIDNFIINNLDRVFALPVFLFFIGYFTPKIVYLSIYTDNADARRVLEKQLYLNKQEGEVNDKGNEKEGEEGEVAETEARETEDVDAESKKSMSWEINPFNLFHPQHASRRDVIPFDDDQINNLRYLYTLDNGFVSPNSEI